MITFAVSGLWHGANWTYIAWGVLNGFYLLVGTSTKSWRDRVFGLIGLPRETLLRQTIMLVSTFVLTLLGWIVFRARNMEDAWYVVTHFAQGWDFRQIGTEQFLLRQLPVAVASIVLLEISQLLHGKISVPSLLTRLPLVPRWALYAGFVMVVVMFGIYQKTQFI